MTFIRLNLIRAVSSNELLIVLSEMGLRFSCFNVVFLLMDGWNVTVVEIVFSPTEVEHYIEPKMQTC